MKPKPQLKLEATGQYLSMPLVGAHDNEKPSPSAVEKCMAQMERVSGN